MSRAQIDAVAAHARAIFPAGTTWKTPDGYPGSLALCILDSIWSIGVNYDRHVIPVLSRYRGIGSAAGRDPDFDTPADLALTIERCGGPDLFAEAVGSRHRTSSRNGILKAEAVDAAARLLCSQGILTAIDLADREAAVKPDWLRIRGQSSGVSWKYFLMLAGIDGIKPDRMIHGFISGVIGAAVTNEEAVEILTCVQRAWPEPRPTLLELDHAIWLHQSGRTTA
ncbi:MAG: hypothetical protein HY828_18805 [Actinobacteria bacterium]|nr:hypothetical protein [Actinomycetota bacterium]